jgi:hypothetical protein
MPLLLLGSKADTLLDGCFATMAWSSAFEPIVFFYHRHRGRSGVLRAVALSFYLLLLLCLF